MNEGEKPVEQSPVVARAPEGVSELTLKLRQAFERKEDKNSLRKVGDLMYDTFKQEKYAPEEVLSSIKETYEANKNKFTPPLSLYVYIMLFGPGLVRLCQEKLLAAGNYDLGKYGKNKDGIDGILGNKTKGALRRFFTGEVPGAKPVSDVEISKRKEERPGKVAEQISPKRKLEAQISEEYKKRPTVYTTDNMDDYFGRTERQFLTYITKKDPISGQEPIMFLGRPIQGGLNLAVLPFLRVAEEEIEKSGIKYRPREANVKGFFNRGMSVRGKITTIPSFHKYGLAFDIDVGTNGPSYKRTDIGPRDNRGDIPDQIVLAMVKAGFAWGGIGSPEFRYLGDDPMHFQLRFPPDSKEGQDIIMASAKGKEYWEAVSPVLYANGMRRSEGRVA